MYNTRAPQALATELMSAENFLSRRATAVQSSSTLAIGAEVKRLVAAGQDIINLCAGEPDFDTPVTIRQAAARAMDEGQTRYTPVAGLPMLRQAIVAKLQRENELRYEEQQVLVSCGCKHSLYNLFQAVLNPGDEVIIPAPYWTSYPEMVILAGGQPMIVSSTMAEGFKLTAAQLQQAVSPRTRVLLINSPNNPSGACYSDAELRALAEVLMQHEQVLVISDDIYEHLQWSGSPFRNIVNIEPQLQERTVVCNGVSKAYAMTGWRIGYAAGPVPIISAMTRIQSHSTSNASAISQAAASAALRGNQDMVAEFCRTFRQRHDYVYGRLEQMPDVQCRPATGTFYLLPDFQLAMARNGTSDDVAFAKWLLEQAGLAMVPGSAFGAQGKQRISFASDLPTLERAMDRLQETLAVRRG